MITETPHERLTRIESDFAYMNPTMENQLETQDSTADFRDLLLRYSQHFGVDRREDIALELWKRFGTTATVLIVDMSGYSKSIRQFGVVHYLSMIHRLQLTLQPIVENYGGSIVKFEADNADARFDCPGNAIQACIALNLALDSANILTPSELDVHVSCGIDHGECLIPDNSHFYGKPVIHASKLGEDLGMPGQILVTKRAMELVPASLGIRDDLMNVEIAGVSVDVHSIKFRRAENTAPT